MKFLRNHIATFRLTFFLILIISLFTVSVEAGITSISINNGKTLYLNVNDFITLEVKTNPSNVNIDNITFSSSSPDIAAVDYMGNVTAKKAGNTVITASLDGKSSSITVRVSAVNKSLGVNFSVKDVPGTDFKEITAAPVRFDSKNRIIEDENDYLYYIYLPSGYFVEGKSASFIADKNGEYPFTVYDRNNNKRTLFYTVNNIKSNSSKTSDDNNSSNISFDYKLMYDYEKKQVLFNLNTDKQRTVITPAGTYTSNVVNYYINTLKNNIPFDFSIKIDDKSFNYKIIRQGEFYLLIEMSPLNYDEYSTLVKYTAYNFTTDEKYITVPSKDIFYDNGSYKVLVQSDSLKELFIFTVNGIDFRRPSVDISILDDNTLNLDIKDDFNLSYIITFDGKYVPIKGKEASYNHKTPIAYNGNYNFTVVDKAGNRTNASATINFMKEPSKYRIDFNVHSYKYTKNLFNNLGLEFKKEDSSVIFEIAFPPYMKGIDASYFKPDYPVTRAEIITMFCRITDLPYDSGAFLKNKYTDIAAHWAKDYISMGSIKKYVLGYKDKTFKPDNKVTKAEFCQMITNISDFKTKLSGLPATSNYDFKDIYGHWAQKQITTAVNRDIVLGDGNYFYPDKPITRGEVVRAINKIYNLNPTKDEFNHINWLYNNYYSFNDIKNSIYYKDIIISVIGMYREKIN